MKKMPKSINARPVSSKTNAQQAGEQRAKNFSTIDACVAYELKFEIIENESLGDSN